MYRNRYLQAIVGLQTMEFDYQVAGSIMVTSVSKRTVLQRRGLNRCHRKSIRKIRKAGFPTGWQTMSVPARDTRLPW